MHTLDYAGYYSPTACLLLGADGVVQDINLAGRVLFEAEWLGGGLGLPLAAIEFAHSSDAAERLFPEAVVQVESRASRGEPIFWKAGARFGCFGELEIRGTSLTRIPNLERVLFLEVAGPGGSRYGDAFRTARNHERTWEEYSISYDRVVGQMPYYQHVVARHCDLLRARSCRRIADLGAGTGNVALALARAGCDVTAVDLSRPMLARFRAKLEESPQENCQVIQQSIEYLQGVLPSDEFEGVSLLLVLFDVDCPRRALDEAVRVLQPGGTLVITEPRQRFALDVILKECERVLQERDALSTYAEDLERVFRANRVIDPSRREGRLVAEQIEGELRRRGFRDVQIRDSHLGQCATVSGIKP